MSGWVLMLVFRYNCPETTWQQVQFGMRMLPTCREGAGMLLCSLSMVTKYMPPCCRAKYVWCMKQNRRSKYNNGQS